MTDTSFDLSGKLPPEIEAVLQQVADILIAQSIPFFVVGAMARDLLLEHIWHLPPQRATKDVDFGVRLADWQQFTALKNALLATGEFDVPTPQPQRLIHQRGVTLDLVPFGAIESPPGTIHWPPKQAVRMTTLGFQEAYQCAVQVRLGGEHAIPVCAPDGLALLKLIAWDERRERKDASDFGVLVYYYLEVGNEEHLFTEHADLLELPDHKLAGARMLGRDLVRLLNDQSLPLVASILERETSPRGKYQLVSGIVASCRFLDGDVDRALALLEAVAQGVREKS